jgi:hypothetical protein
LLNAQGISEFQHLGEDGVAFHGLVVEEGGSISSALHHQGSEI